MKILLPVDNSPLSEHAVSFVASRASLLGENPEVTLFNVQTPFSNRSALLGQEKIDAYYHAAEEKAFGEARKKLSMAGDFSPRTDRGRQSRGNDRGRGR